MNNNAALTEKIQPFPILAEDHFHYFCQRIVNRHQHSNVLEFFMLNQGTGSFFAGEQTHPIKPGDYVLINSNEYHYFEAESESVAFTIFKIKLDLLHVLSPAGAAPEYIQKICYNQILFKARPEDAVIRQDLQEVSAFYKAKDIVLKGNECNKHSSAEPPLSADSIQQLKLLALTFDILYRLLEFHIDRHFNEKDALLFGNNWKKLYKLREYMDKNYSSKITLEEAAEITGMSKGYFCSKFKQNTGKSFVDYLNLLRVEKSLSLLSGSTQSITDIAFSSGFEDVNYYCRVFKKYMKQSPSEFRKNNSK